MKKHFISLFAITFSSLAYSQVGVNTPNPQGAFSIDAQKNNPTVGTPSAAQQSDDFTVASDGKVGIGTSIPSTRLEINNGTTAGALKIVDGTQGANKVLTSDVNGIATWQSSSTDTTGADVKKIKYEGSAALDNQTLQVGPVEFRYAANGTIPQMRFTTPLTQNTQVAIQLAEFYHQDAYNYRMGIRLFTPADWNTWQNVVINNTDGMSNMERNELWVSIQGSNDIYCIQFIILTRGGSNNIYSIISTKY